MVQGFSSPELVKLTISVQLLVGKLTVYNPIRLLTTLLRKKALENTVGKGENAVTSIFSFSHSVFYSIKERNHHFSKI